MYLKGQKLQVALDSHHREYKNVQESVLTNVNIQRTGKTQHRESCVRGAFQTIWPSPHTQPSVRHDGGRRKQGCFDASTEPRWSDVTGILGRTKCPYGRATDLLNGLDFMAYTLCLTIADGNVAGNLLIIAELIRSWHLRVRETDPTGVQAKCLGEQDQMLAVVTHSLIKVVGVLSGHDEIVLYVSELAVFGYRPLKCLRLVEDELDMKMAFLIDHGNLFS